MKLVNKSEQKVPLGVVKGGDLYVVLPHVHMTGEMNLRLVLGKKYMRDGWGYCRWMCHVLYVVI